MARRYVRDKIGRFASHGGGGSFGGGGKVGKSAKNVKARAAYKNQAGKLREAKKSTYGKPGTRERKYWNQQLGGAKSGYTRVTNRLAGKGKSAAVQKALGSGAKQKRGVKKRKGAKVYDNSTNQMFKSRKLKRDLKRKYPQSKASKRIASKANRGSAATKRDRILRTAKKNVMKSGGIKSAAFDRRVKRLQKAEDIMTKAMGGSTAWKNF
jgi:hypothetical protein